MTVAVRPRRQWRPDSRGSGYAAFVALVKSQMGPAAWTLVEQPCGPFPARRPEPHEALQFCLKAATVAYEVDEQAWAFTEVAHVRQIVNRIQAVAQGETPVLYLSAGQQDALVNTDPPSHEEAMQAPSAFTGAQLVVFATPLQMAEDMVALAADFDVDMKGCHIFCGLDKGNAVMLIEVAFDGAAGSQELVTLQRVLLSIGYAARLFGLTDLPPAMSRAQHRQLARSVQKTLPVSAGVKIRYLRDPHASIKVGSATTTGRSVRPHWRRGHWRHVWVGQIGRDDRKAVLRLIAPVLVNSHRGTPPPSIYSWSKRTDAS